MRRYEELPEEAGRNFRVYRPFDFDRRVQGEVLCFQPQSRVQCGDNEADILPDVQIVDADGNGLIDITTIEQLNNIRYNLAGTSYRTSADVEGLTTGCPDGVCIGYELLGDLDFALASSYASGEVDLSYCPLNAAGAVTLPESALNGGFVPFGYYFNSQNNAIFSAVFEGNGYVIRNLFARYTPLELDPSAFGGLFSTIGNGASVRNIGLENVYVEGGRVSTGGLIGEVVGQQACVIYNVYLTGRVGVTTLERENRSASAGGLLAYNYYGNVEIRNAYVQANVVLSGSGSTAGGLVGSSYQAPLVLRNCYATGGVRASVVGGLVGFNQASAGNLSIIHSYATNALYPIGDAGLAGGLLGRNAADGYTVLASYFDVTRSAQVADGGSAAALTTENLQALTAETTGWSENDWDFGNGSQYPTLRRYVTDGIDGAILQGSLFCGQPTSRVQCAGDEADILPDVQIVDADGDGLIDIRTVEQLNNIRYNVAGTSYRTSADAEGLTTGCPDGVCSGYELLGDIDFALASSYASGEVDAAYYRDSYQLDQGAFTPIGYYNSRDDNAVFSGIFEGNGYSIINLRVLELRNAGLFGAIGYGAEVRNLGLRAINVRVPASETLSSANAGGLAGRSIGGSTISRCHVYGEVASIRRAGGLIGRVNGDLSVISSSSGVRLVSIRVRNIHGVIGGLIGTISRRGSILITDSSFTGAIDGNGLIGGLVGRNAGASLYIVNAYYNGRAIEGGYTVGGLIGSNRSRRNSRTTISYSYANLLTANIGRTVGGLVGRSRRRSNIVIRSSYVDGNLSARRFAGGLIGGASRRARLEVSDSYISASARARRVRPVIGRRQETGQITACYYTLQPTGRASSAATQLTTEALQALTTGLDENNWDFGTASQYPALRSLQVDNTGAQVVGVLVCNQPLPRAQCGTEAATPIVAADTSCEDCDLVVEETVEVIEEESDVDEPSLVALSVYPNPTTGRVLVALNGVAILSITVRNAQGEEVFDALLRDNRETSIYLDISNFASGVYLLDIQGANGQVYTQRLVLQ